MFKELGLRFPVPSGLFEIVCDIIQDSRKVVLTGLGKSFLVVQLAARIANSYGLKWYPLDAATAFHGDIGIISPRDTIIFVSKSGETREVVEIAKRTDNNRKISITFSPRRNTSLASETININSPINERAPHEHAPLTSSIAALCVLHEIIRKAAAEAYSETYSANHSAGEIGRLSH